MRRSKRGVFVGLVLMPSAAIAHDADEVIDGVSGGLLHLLSGVDHLGVLILAGMIATRLCDRSARTMPAFLAAGLAVGAALGSANPGLAHLETISATLAGALLLGSLLGWQCCRPVIPALFLALGVTQGYLHGREATIGGAPFLAGLLIGSGGVMVAAMLISSHVTRLRGWRLGRDNIRFPSNV